jgi:hypothetical protein
LVDYEVLDREGDLACLLLRGELEGDIPSEVLKRELSLITLDGVGILLELWNESRRRGKRFVVQDPHGQVREKLRVTGLLGTLSEQ